MRAQGHAGTILELAGTPGRSQRKAIKELFHVVAFTVAMGIAFLIGLGLMIVGMYIAERIGIEL